MNTLTLFNQRENILAFAKERLSDEHQQIFVEHFLMSISSPDDPFPITGIKAMEWLGFLQKHKFKEMIKKHLRKDVDYKFLLTPSGEQTNLSECGGGRVGGHNHEEIRISIDGFKILEMVARTKKGDLIRSYYPMLEKMVYDYSIIQHQKALQEAQQQVTNIQYVLEAERENIARKLRRKVNVQESKDVVYIYQEGPNTIKVGECMDVDKREAEHRSSSYLNRIVYAKKCSNRKLLEKVMHHILDQYRIDPQREWFNCTFDVAKEALDVAHLFLDGLVDRCSSIHKNHLCDRLQALFTDVLDIQSHETPSNAQQDTSPEEVQNQDNGIDMHDDESDTEHDIGNTVNPLDFDRFIDECCTKGCSKYAFTAEVFGAHRLWSRCCLKTTHDALYKYLRTRFTAKKRFDPNTNAMLASIQGISLKPFVRPLSKCNNDVDMFIQECCVTGYTYRIAGKDLYDAYAAWKQERVPGYELSAEESRRLCRVFSRMFVPASVYVQKMSRRGFFGIDVKGSESNKTGLKLAEKLKKTVHQIDIQTKRIVATYESLSHAARSIGRCNGNLSSDIKYEKPWNGYVFKYA